MNVPEPKTKLFELRLKLNDSMRNLSIHVKRDSKTMSHKLLGKPKTYEYRILLTSQEIVPSYFHSIRMIIGRNFNMVYVMLCNDSTLISANSELLKGKTFRKLNIIIDISNLLSDVG